MDFFLGFNSSLYPMLVNFVAFVFSMWFHSLVPFIRAIPLNAIIISLQWHPLKFTMEVESMELLKLTCNFILNLILTHVFHVRFLRFAAIRFGNCYLAQGLAHATIFFYNSFIWLWLSTLEPTFGWRGVSIGYAIFFFIIFQLLKILVLANDKNSCMKSQVAHSENESRSDSPTLSPAYSIIPEPKPSPSPMPVPSPKSKPEPATLSFSRTHYNFREMDLNWDEEGEEELKKGEEEKNKKEVEGKEEKNNDIFALPSPTAFQFPDYSLSYSFIPEPNPKPVSKPKPPTVPVRRARYNFREMDLNWNDEEEEEEKLKKEEEEKKKKEVEEKEEKNKDIFAMPPPMTFQLHAPSAPYLPPVLFYAEGEYDGENHNDNENENEEIDGDEVSTVLDAIKGLKLDDEMDWEGIGTSFFNVTNLYNHWNIPIPPATVYYVPSAPPIPPELANLISN